MNVNQRMRLYRARKRQELGEIEYKRVEAEKRAQRRARQLAPLRQRPPPLPATLPPDSDDETPPPLPATPPPVCDDLFEEVYESKKADAEARNKTLSRASFKRNTWANLLGIYKLVFNKQWNCSSLAWVKQHTRISEVIKNKYSNLNSRITKLSSIASVLKGLPRYKKDYDFYSVASVRLRSAQNKVDDKNKPKDKELVVKWKDLKNHWKNKDLYLPHRVLMGMYTVIPPRRLEMAQLLTLGAESTKQSPNLNYLIYNATDKAFEIHLNKYKTFKKYGRQVLKLTNKTFNALIKRYIKEFKITAGKPVFPTSNNKHYSNFNHVVASAFRKSTNKEITINVLRHSYITDFASKKRSIEQKKQLAVLMAHGVDTQAKYLRL